MPPCIRRPRRNIATPFGMEQELSYGKQIARHLRTQYVTVANTQAYFDKDFKNNL